MYFNRVIVAVLAWFFIAPCLASSAETIKVYTDIGPLGEKAFTAKPKLMAVHDRVGTTKVYTDIGPLGDKAITAKPNLIIESGKRSERGALVLLLISSP